MVLLTVKSVTPSIYCRYETTTTNFSLSNVRVGIQTKNHPMPYDPANFSFSYSHSHSHTSGETTVYENEDNWRGALNYNWTPVYKSWGTFQASYQEQVEMV